MLYINDIKSHIPSETYSIYDLRDRFDLDEIALTIYNRIYGLESIPVSHRPFSMDMVADKVQALIADNDVEMDDVSMVCFTHTVTNVSPFGTAFLNDLKTLLGLKQAMMFGMSTNNCVSSSFALELIGKQLKCKPKSCAILITYDVAYSKESQLIQDSTVLGDGFCVSLVSQQPKGFKLLENNRNVYGQHAQCSWEDGESLQQFQDEYTPRLQQVLRSTLDDAEMTIDEVRHIVPHNVNRMSWKKVTQSEGLDSDKVFLENLPKTAHCFGSDVFINLETIKTQGLVDDKDYLLVGNSGLGAVFNGMLLQYVAA